MAKLVRKGGKGSGNWGHAGRPGKVGGSAKNKFASPQGELFDRSSYYVPPTPFETAKKKIEEEGIERVLGSPSPPDGISIPDMLTQQDEWYESMLRTMPDYDPLETDEYAIWKYFDSLTVEDLKKLGLSEKTINGFLREWRSSSNSGTEDLFLQNEAAELFHGVFGTTLSGWQKSRVMYEAMFGSLQQFDEQGHGKEIYHDLDEAIDGLAKKQRFFVHEKDVDSVTDAKLKTRELLAGMYNRTQDQLAAAGVDGVYLFRGIKRDDAQITFLGEELMADDNNVLESWTSDPSMARRFGADVSPMYPEELGFEPDMDLPDNIKLSVNQGGLILGMYVPRERILSTPFSGLSMAEEKEYVILNTSGTDDTDDISEAVAVYTVESGIEENKVIFDKDYWDDVYENNAPSYL